MNNFSKEKLKPISWLFKNMEFDKSTGTFKNETDLFSFLGSVNRFSYNDEIIYDDFYYILEYTQEPIKRIINNINYKIIRTHKKIHLSKAKEFDSKTITYLSKKTGRTLREKLNDNKILAVQREMFFDTPENRLFKKFLKKIVDNYNKRDDLNNFQNLYREIIKWLKSETALLINEKKPITHNNLLLHHKEYHKIFKAHKWLEEYPDRLELYYSSYEFLKKYVLLFELFQQFQYYTSEIVIPQPMKVDIEKLKIITNKKVLLNSLKLDISKEIEWNNIRNYITDFLKTNNYEITQNKCFYMSKVKEAYVYLFSLVPFFYIEKPVNINNYYVFKEDKDYVFVKMPVALKQLIYKQIVNCNGTKIINLNNECYTLSDILNSFNLEVLNLFLKDFKNIFNKIYYIVPDFVNAFEFIPIRKAINAYFNSKHIPESITAIFDDVCNNKYQDKDTILYISFFNNKVYVTPLLIKYDKTLDEITNGLYIEKHPTKLLDELEFENLELIEKFQFDGLKYLADNKVLIIKNNKILSIPDFINLKEYKQKLDKIKKLYSNKNLFTSNIIFKFSDEEVEKKVKNLKMVSFYESKGYKIWKEHLPNLSLEVFVNGYYEEFVLIDDTTELINNKLEIKEHFIIPKNVKELNLPLIFENDDIGFDAYISSSQMPFDKDIECKLVLNYNYDAENPYDLEFIPLNKEIKPLKVIWKKHQKTYNKLPYPEFPPKKDWNDLENDKKGDKVSNLLEWILERLEWLEINEIPTFIVEKEIKEVLSSLKKGNIVSKNKDREGNYFYFVKVDNIQQDVFCHSNDFINKDILFENINIGDEVYLKLIPNKKNPNKFNGKYVIWSYDNIDKLFIEDLLKDAIKKKLLFLNSKKSFKEKTQQLINPLRSIRVPLLKIWANKTLNDEDTPIEFKENMQRYILLAEKLFFNSDTDEEAKKELKFFLSAVREDAPEKFSQYLINLSTNIDLIKENNLYLSLSLGDLQLDWQKEIFSNLLSFFKEHPYPEFLKILSKSIWRSDKVVFHLKQNAIPILIYLLNNLKNIFGLYKTSQKTKHKKTLISLLELLLGLLMLRKKNNKLLHPDVTLTKGYIKIINEIIKFFVINEIQLDSRIEIEVNKPDEMNKVPDLLYTIRFYLKAEEDNYTFIKLKGIKEEE